MSTEATSSFGEQLIMVFVGVAISIAAAVLTFIIATKTRLAVMETKQAIALTQLKENTDLTVQIGKVLVEQSTMLKVHQGEAEKLIPILNGIQSKQGELEKQVEILKQKLAALEARRR